MPEVPHACRRLPGAARPDALELADLPTPEPGACGVRIRVRAAGVNFADSLMLAGRYQEKPSLPFTWASSSRARSRPVRRRAGLQRGQRVLAVVSHGAFAEQVARAEDVVPLPDDMDDVTAAGFAIAYGTAHGALRWRAGLHAGESLVVHGAGSGVGLTAVECGKAIGAVVIATAREEKLAVARDHGADHAVDSEDPDLKGRLRELTDGRGADVVYDPVGGAVFDASLRAIAWEGRIVIIGFASGQVPQIPANLLLVKNASVVGFYWGSYRKHDPERLRDSFRELFVWHREGRIRPPRVADPAPAASGRRHPAAGRKACHRQDRGDHA